MPNPKYAHERVPDPFASRERMHNIQRLQTAGGMGRVPRRRISRQGSVSKSTPCAAGAAIRINHCHPNGHEQCIVSRVPEAELSGSSSASAKPPSKSESQKAGMLTNQTAACTLVLCMLTVFVEEETVPVQKALVLDQSIGRGLRRMRA